MDEIGRAVGVTKQTAWARLWGRGGKGKTKIVKDAGDGEVLIRSKDDITAGDGAKHDVLKGRAAASTRTTCNVFRLLERNGIPTHFVDRVDDIAFRARDVTMNSAGADGATVRRRQLPGPVDDGRYAYIAPELIVRLRSLTASPFEVIENAWKQNVGVYVDLKIECGFDLETGELLVADVIDSDSAACGSTRSQY